MRHLALTLTLATWLLAMGSHAQAQFTQNAFQLTPPHENLPDRNGFTQAPQEPGNRPYPDKVLVFESHALLWALPRNPTPIVTAGGTGVVGQPGTNVLYGDDVSLNPFPGYRGVFTLMQPEYEIELGGFFILQQSDNFTARSDNSVPPLFVAFQNVTPPATGQNAAFAVSATGAASTLAVATSTQFWGLETNFYKPLWEWEGKCFGGGVLLGYRYMNLNDQLTLDTSLVRAGANTTLTADSFESENQFHGLQVGVRGSYKVTPLVSLDGVFKTAVGVSAADVNIKGTTSAAGATTPIGILALPTNIGRRSEAQFSVVPHGLLKASWAPLDWIHVCLGCEALYWADVARAGDQMDRSLNLTQRTGALVGPARPSPAIVYDDLFVYGIFASIEFAY